MKSATLINYAAAAARLGVPTGTLRSMVNRKQVPHIRLTAGTVVFDVGALDAWRPQLADRIASTIQADIDASKRGRDLYVVFCTVTRLCKIGRSNDAYERLRDMQIGSPTRLVLWCHAPLLGKLEPRLHVVFSGLRLHGEWFGHGLTEQIATAVPSGDVEAFARFAESASAKYKRPRAVGPVDRRLTFEWRGKRRPA